MSSPRQAETSLESSRRVAFSYGAAASPARGQQARSLLLNFEVDDVDAEYQRAVAQGLPMLLALRDEDFGQRHFIVQDPNGVMIDVIQPIPPSEAFLSQYAEGAAAGGAA